MLVIVFIYWIKNIWPKIKSNSNVVKCNYYCIYILNSTRKSALVSTDYSNENQLRMQIQ